MNEAPRDLDAALDEGLALLAVIAGQGLPAPPSSARTIAHHDGAFLAVLARQGPQARFAASIASLNVCFVRDRPLRRSPKPVWSLTENGAERTPPSPSTYRRVAT